ncbi:MAG: end-binding protein Ku [Variibacter sp.]|jgi:non-homologous end joining protein Ku|nr:end-binding protein Ku [Variibacter sp.]
MAPRPNWKGYLKLSLVSCPIALYPAVSAAERISFRQVNRDTGNRLKQQLVDSVTGDVVDTHNKGRGYEVGENQFLMVQEEELEAAQSAARSAPYSVHAPAGAHRVKESSEEVGNVPEPRTFSRAAARPAPEPEPLPPPPPVVKVENNHTIEIERFIPYAQLDARYYDTPYYIVPRDEVGQEAFAVIRDAMRGKGMVAMGRVVLSKRERPIALEPMGNGLRGITLRYTHEIRDAEPYFDEIPQIDLPDEMLRVAEHILETKTEDFDPALLEDRYRTQLVALLKEKQAKELPVRIAAPTSSRENVISLMDALKRSLAAEKPTERRKPTAAVKQPPARKPRRPQARVRKSA